MKSQENSFEYEAPQLNKDGSEILSDVSLVAIADLRPITLGERIRRYERTPQFLHDQNSLDGYDEGDDFSDVLLDRDESPLSQYEDRAEEIRGRIRERKKAEKAAEKEAAIAKEKAEKDAFRKRYQELQNEAASLNDSEGATPTT